MATRTTRGVRRRTRAILRRLGGRDAPTSLDPAEAAIFTPEYYREIHPDVRQAGLDPVSHWVSHGRAEGRRPGPVFDPQWYLAQNPDVAAAGADPLEHFLTHGGTEGRDPIPAGFATAWYLDRYPEVARAGENPLLHYLTRGAELGFDPSPYFETTWYLAKNPDVAGSQLNPLVHFLWHGEAEGRSPNRRGDAITGARDAGLDGEPTVGTLLGRRDPDQLPLRVIRGPSVPRITIVTDSIGPESLFGGVATAIILGSLWADRTGRRLRLVTRHSVPDGAGLHDLFGATGIRTRYQPELAYAPPGNGDFLDLGDDDIFLTTSWWSTRATLQVVEPERVVYLLQEDERCFYPAGTKTLAAAAVMDHPAIQVVVNTRSLLDHLVDSGLESLTATAVSFEPSFAAFLRPGRRLADDAYLNLFFYARPNNPRNLFDLGLAAIDRAIELGGLPRARWRLHVAGRDIPPLSFCDGSRPLIHPGLGWTEYRGLIGRMDLGLALMASPHPSYPPLDLAAGGAVVVTNSWPGKKDLSAVSDRILTSEPTVVDLSRSILAASDRVEALADEPFSPWPTEYFAPWSVQLAGVVEHLVRRFGDV